VGLRPFLKNVVGGEEDAEGARENGREREAVKTLVMLELERRVWRCSGDTDRLLLRERVRSPPVRLDLWLVGGVVPVEYGDSGSLLQTPVDESAEPYIPKGVPNDLGVG